MNRIFRAIGCAAVFSISSAGAFAATVQSSFEVNASTVIELVSATYSVSGGDATAAIMVLPIGFPSEDSVFFNEGDSRKTVLALESDERSLSATIGSAGQSTPGNSPISRANIAAFIDRAFLNDQDQGEAINLVLSYSMTSSIVATHGASGAAFGRAKFGVTDSIFAAAFTETYSFDGPGLANGTVSFTIAPGEAVSASAFATSFAEAPEPVLAPVPLPAGLPLVLSGLVLLGLQGRRKSRSQISAG